MLSNIIIKCVENQSYAPWIDPTKVNELHQITLQDQVSHWLKNQIIDVCSWLWQGTLGLSFWIACIGGVACIILYAFSKSNKPIRWIGYLSGGYLFIQAINWVVK